MTKYWPPLPGHHHSQWYRRVDTHTLMTVTWLVMWGYLGLSLSEWSLTDNVPLSGDTILSPSLTPLAEWWPSGDINYDKLISIVRKLVRCDRISWNHPCPRLMDVKIVLNLLPPFKFLNYARCHLLLLNNTLNSKLHKKI